MLEQSALIVEANEQYIWLESADDQSCSHCSAKQGCGTASLQKWFKRKPNRLRIENSHHLTTGDMVILGIPEQALVMGSLMLYLLPLLFMLAGALVGNFLAQWLSWSNHDFASIVGAVLAFAGSFVLLRRFALNGGKADNLNPVILRADKRLKILD